ncbi:hypothetical protein MNBD_NITROSPINAE01-57 [hydrothermal vent metagenome]|uniref:J domain-containing protein n=1 Tax=hydrothermal vent metagenome TaxID=652676 RepID=A0A3B1CKC0_9ZZZZ
MTPKQAYDLLEIDEQTPMDGVKQSFRRAAKLYHPDTASGLGDTDKFHMVATAYEIIIKERREPGSNITRKPQNDASQKSDFTFPYFIRFLRRKRKEKQARKNGEESAGRRFTASSLLTYKELLIRFDRAPSDWVKIEAAHAIYSHFNEKFESFAVPNRISSKTPEKVLVELIDILGRIGSPTALEAIAQHLSNRNRKICCSAFIALDRAGEPGHKVIDKKLGTKSAISYFIDGFFRRSDLERCALKQRIVSRQKMRRLIAVMRETGLPLRELLDGIGVKIQQTAPRL